VKKYRSLGYKTQRQAWPIFLDLAYNYGKT